MSKASEWAANKPKQFQSDQICADVTMDGWMQTAVLTQAPISPAIAVLFARWIIATFGEDGGSA